MEVDLDTMLDIALAGPEIGPLNLHVLHGLMRNVFERLNISKECVKVDDSQSEFSDSCNFIRSKLDTMPKSASGENRRLKSKVSVIVSNYARVPIGEQQQPADIDSISNCPLQIEERLKCVETKLCSMKEFPSVDELRDWAKEKASPDTVVTDLWHFVSLNHRMNGAEEGIQKLTELVDKLIPELKSVWEEGMHMSGRIDDLYSQFKGLSDRMTYIDEKLDAASQDISHKLEDIETRLMQLPTFDELKDYVTVDQYMAAEDAAKRAANEMRDYIAQKLDATQAEFLVSKDELGVLDEKINEVDDRLSSGLQEHDDYVTKDDFAESLEKIDDSLAYLYRKVDGKTDTEKIEELESGIEDMLSKINEDVGNLKVLQDSLQNDIKNNRKSINEKPNANDLSELTTKVNKNTDVIHDFENWKDAFENNDDKALILSRLDQHDAKTNELNKTLCALKEEEERAKELAKENEEEDKVSTRFLQDGQNQMQEKFKAHAQACNDNIAKIIAQLEDKLNRDELTSLKDYVDSNLKSLPHQKPMAEQQTKETGKEKLDESLNGGKKIHRELSKVHNDQEDELLNNESPIQVRISANNEQSGKSAGQQPNNVINGVYHPSPPPYNNRNNRSPKRFSTNESLGCSHPQYDQSQFIPYLRDDAAIIRTQMKFNCLSCGRPLCMQGNQHMQTTRGRPLNAYDLENMRLLQSMLNQDATAVEKEKRSCGGRHTTSVTPLPSSAKPSAKILPMVSNNTSASPPVDEEVDIEGVDGRLYRGLVNKTELPMLQNS